MPITEVMLPPWVRPETPERIQLIDDQTIAFQPAFARNAPQFQTFADPRWGWTRRYSAMRQEERGVLLSTLSDMRGKVIKCHLTPHAPFRGSMGSLAPEMIPNGTFVNSINGWLVSDSTLTLSAIERIMRINVAANGDTVVMPQGAVSVAANVPYALRMMLKLGKITGTGPVTQFRMGTASFTDDIGASAVFDTDGYKTFAVTCPRTVVYPGFAWFRSSYNMMPNDFVYVHYFSMTRCLLVDVGVNKILHSQDLTQAYWTRTGISSIAANASFAPDGTGTADILIETNSLQQHYVLASSGTASGAPNNWSLSVALKSGTRTIARLALTESSSSTIAQAWFQTNSGTTLASSTGDGWSNLQTFVQSLGGGWWECAMSARNINASPLITPLVAMASSNTAITYTGSSQTMSVWRPTLAATIFPGRLVSTGASSDDGGSPNGGAVHIKGGPASINGLILSSDWIEIVTSTGSELKQVTAAFNTDALGRGYLQFRPGLTGQVLADGIVIVTEPFGRFRLMNGAEYDNRFGLYADFPQLEFTETYA